ncbi:hypothetical protein ACFVHB_01570 [Kitasatospora sp. NPDC127111]
MEEPEFTATLTATGEHRIEVLKAVRVLTGRALVDRGAQRPWLGAGSA